MRLQPILCAAALVLAPPAAAQENYESWPLLVNPFESTGGGGIMIGGYEPIVVDRTCVTDFTVTTPAGEIYDNTIVFTAVPTQGGILCTDGKWRARDGSASGTTPFRVFINDGVKRRSP